MTYRRSAAGRAPGAFSNYEDRDARPVRCSVWFFGGRTPRDFYFFALFFARLAARSAILRSTSAQTSAPVVTDPTLFMKSLLIVRALSGSVRNNSRMPGDRFVFG